MTKEAAEVERVLGRRSRIREEIAIRKTNVQAVEQARLMPELGETRETLTPRPLQGSRQPVKP